MTHRMAVFTLLAALTVSAAPAIGAHATQPGVVPTRACPSADTKAQSAAGLAAAEDARFAAQVAGDISEVNAGLAEELTYVHAMGMRQTKAEYLAALTNGRSRYTSMSASGRVAEVCGPFGWTRAFYTVVIGDVTLRSSYLAVYAWREGRWQLLSWQTTPPPTEGAGPSRPALQSSSH